MNYSFDINIAKEYGVNEAIMIQNFIFWISKNKANNKNSFDGHTWTFNSVRAYKKLFPFWSEKQIRRILQSLLNKGILIKGNYNKMQYDRTIWYSFKSENRFLTIDQNSESILPNGQMEEPERANRNTQKGEPIPDNKPNNLPDNKPNKIQQVVDDDFERFWTEYEYKKDRGGCIKKWNKLTKKEKQEIFDYLPAYIASTPQKKYRQHPSTFLNKRTWEDEITESKPVSKYEAVMPK